MIFPRSHLLFAALGCAWGTLAAAQQPTSPAGGTGAGGAPSGGGASSSFGAPGTGTPSAPGSSSAAPSFRTGTGTTEPSTTPTAPPGAASTFGAPAQDAPETRAAPESFSIPGQYGRGGLQFTVGEGRLNRPRFRTSASVSIGYDDNVFQTPTKARGTPDQEIQVLVRPAVAATPATVNPVTGVVTPATTGQEAEFRTETIEGTPGPKRIGSFITRTGLDFDMQFASRRTLFTFDLNGGVGYYWDRPGKKEEFSGSLALIYLRRLTSRAQFTAAASASYRDQPDFSQVNSPTSNSRGSYLTADAKADVSYRLTPRISSVTSVAYNTVYSVEEDSQSGNYSETTFGTELRYLFSPRLTLLGEVRYSSQIYEEEDNSSQTVFVLAGGELTLSRRFTATLRLGEQWRTFDNANEPSSVPYVEGTIAYRLGRGTTLQMNARYGFEASSDGGNSENKVARLGMTLSQVFAPRLLGSLSLNLLRSERSSRGEVAVLRDPPSTVDPTVASSDPNAEPEPVETRTVTNESVQDTVDATLAFQYALNRRWSFNLNYSYTLVLDLTSENDYYRQRVFLGAEYRF